MSLDPAGLLDSRLKPSSHERKFEEFLKQHELHFTQSECGLGWVQRYHSNSGIYQHSVGLDVVNPAIRDALPSTMGNRSLFRFMIPHRADPHLVASDQQLSVPGVQVHLPKNPDLELDIGALLMMVKANAVRELRAASIDPDVEQVTALMAIWFGWSWLAQAGEQPAHTAGLPAGLIEWLAGLAPPYLCVVKWVWPLRFQDLQFKDALQAKGIPARRLTTLYPMQENQP